MSLIDALRVKEIKAELADTRVKLRDLESAVQIKDAEIARLSEALKQTGALTIEQLKEQIAGLHAQKTEAEHRANEAIAHAQKVTAEMQAQLDSNDAVCRQHIAELNKQIEDKRKHLIVLDEDILLQSFGFYRSHFNLPTSSHFKDRLERNQEAQARLIKGKEAASCPTNWVVDGDKAKGQRMVNDIAKLLIRAFNNECDACVAAVKYNNIDSMEKRIQKAFEALNSLGERTHVSLVNQFLNLKLEELYLTHEYQVMKQKEKEEQKRIREQQREEARILREIEEMKSKLEKEEKHFDKALAALSNQLQTAKTDAEITILNNEIQTIQDKKAEVEEQKKDVLYREQNTRAGYVYVVSNIGSFGENVYKIGVTRRLDPEERVDELGDASVPFYFDTHALIFSDDAPSLENALHRAFDSRRVNAVNTRKEFFRVTLDEIEEVVKTNFSKPVEFKKTIAAQEYRETLMMRQGQPGTN